VDMSLLASSRVRRQKTRASPASIGPVSWIGVSGPRRRGGCHASHPSSSRCIASPPRPCRPWTAEKRVPPSGQQLLHAFAAGGTGLLITTTLVADLLPCLAPGPPPRGRPTYVA